MEVGPPVVVHVIVTLRRSESHVVVARGGITSEVSGRLVQQGVALVEEPISGCLGTLLHL